LAGWSVGRLVGQWAERLAGWFVGWPVGRLTGRSVGGAGQSAALAN